MTEEKKVTKKELETKLKNFEVEREEMVTQLQALSEAYQNLIGANQNLNMLVNTYEGTINVLTARLLEARTQGS